MQIGPGRIINDFIEPNKRQYAIPVYQRNYEWAKEDCIKLFEDIVQAHKLDKQHFCGSVVYAPLDAGLDIQQYVIIDGQQRLTTIYLLIKALMDLAQTENEREAIKESLLNKDKFNSYDTDVATKLKLKPVKTDNNQLLNIMEDNFDAVDKSSGIWANYELFKELVATALEDDPDMDVKRIYNGIEKLTCAKILLENDDNAQEIFERINSTGIPLSLADKIRNFVLMTEGDQDRLFEDYWLKIEQLVNKDYRNDFFYSYLNLKLDEFAKEKEAYDQFKKLFREGGYSNESMLEELLHYAELYNTFLFGNSKYSESINTSLADLQKLKQTTVFLFLFRLFDDLENDVVDEDELAKVLRLLVAYTIRRMMCEVSSNSLRGLYKTLYSRVFNNAENKEHYYDAIASFIIQITTNDAIPTDEEFTDALVWNNLYKKNALCRFLLTSIENQGKEKIVTDNLTIEHILPQNKNLSTKWQEMLGDEWELVRNTYVHTLGNLTLTGYNSELGDRPFDEKQKYLSDDKESKAVILYKDVKGLTEWNEETIKARAYNLVADIFKMYSIEKPEQMISFKDPRYKEYTCDNPDDATYKAPNYYVLNGERVRMTNFAEMLRSIISRLYELDSDIIESMARNNEKILNWSSQTMFSYDIDKVQGNAMIPGTSIYQSSGYSASHIMYIIRALLDRYGIDHEEFVYSARDNK